MGSSAEAPTDGPGSDQTGARERAPGEIRTRTGRIRSNTVPAIPRHLLSARLPSVVVHSTVRNRRRPAQTNFRGRFGQLGQRATRAPRTARRRCRCSRRCGGSMPGYRSGDCPSSSSPSCWAAASPRPAFARRVMADQEHRMLAQRAGEAAALLTNLVTQSQASARRWPRWRSPPTATPGLPPAPPAAIRPWPTARSVAWCGKRQGRYRVVAAQGRPRRRPGTERRSRRRRAPGPGHRGFVRTRLFAAGRPANAGSAGRCGSTPPRSAPSSTGSRSSARPGERRQLTSTQPSARSKRSSTPARRPIPTRSSWPPGPCPSRAAPSTTSWRSAPTAGCWWWRPTGR